MVFKLRLLHHNPTYDPKFLGKVVGCVYIFTEGDGAHSRATPTFFNR